MTGERGTGAAGALDEVTVGPCCCTVTVRSSRLQSLSLAELLLVAFEGTVQSLSARAPCDTTTARECAISTGAPTVWTFHHSDGRASCSSSASSQGAIDGRLAGCLGKGAVASCLGERHLACRLEAGRHGSAPWAAVARQCIARAATCQRDDKTEARGRKSSATGGGGGGGARALDGGIRWASPSGRLLALLQDCRSFSCFVGWLRSPSACMACDFSRWDGRRRSCGATRNRDLSGGSFRALWQHRRGLVFVARRNWTWSGGARQWRRWGTRWWVTGPIVTGHHCACGWRQWTWSVSPKD